MRINNSTSGVLATFGLMTVLASSTASAEGFLGGILELPGLGLVRSVLEKTEIDTLLPSKGKFNFPAPYNTQAIRLTNASDCGGSADCIDSIGYAYWNNTNNHRGQDTMLIFIGMDKKSGGPGPSLLQYNKLTDEVENLGPLFEEDNALSWNSGEGWYFSDTMPTTMYITYDSKFMRYDVMTQQSSTVYDVASHFGKGHYIWQSHSSGDDRVHSATLRRTSDWASLGCMVYREDTSQYSFWPKKGEYDECQIDKSGRWLVIKEDVDGIDGEDNRIINVETGEERLLLDRDGAGGHSDMGYGYMIANDNFAKESNTQRLWKFDSYPLQGSIVYTNNDWRIGAPAHVSHSNTLPGVPPENQYACGSSANRVKVPDGNEIVCFTLDGNKNALVVAPTMTDLNAPGGGDDYTKSPKGNLDVTGQYFIWTSNMGGNRQDAFLVKIPSEKLVAGSSEPGNGPVVGRPAPPQPQLPAQDITPPLLTDIKAVGLKADSAYILFKTTESSQNLVRFGVTSEYGSRTDVETSFQTRHGVRLRNLAPGTVYHYRVYARDAAGNIAESQDLTFTTTGDSVATPGLPGTTPQVPVTPPVAAVPAAVAWSNLVNVTANAGSLKKISGCDGCSDGLAVSSQRISGNSGYLEFTVDEIVGLGLVGLSRMESVTSGPQIDYAIRVQSGYIEVRENGVYRWDQPLQLGDVLRIEVVDGRIAYSRNGKVFYTSKAAPAFPLGAYAALYSTGSGVQKARMVAN